MKFKTEQEFLDSAAPEDKEVWLSMDYGKRALFAKQLGFGDDYPASEQAYKKTSQVFWDHENPTLSKVYDNTIDAGLKGFLSMGGAMVGKTAGPLGEAAGGVGGDLIGGALSDITGALMGRPENLGIENNFRGTFKDIKEAFIGESIAQAIPGIGRGTKSAYRELRRRLAEKRGIIPDGMNMKDIVHMGADDDLNKSFSLTKGEAKGGIRLTMENLLASTPIMQHGAKTAMRKKLWVKSMAAYDSLLEKLYDGAPVDEQKLEQAGYTLYRALENEARKFNILNEEEFQRMGNAVLDNLGAHFNLSDLTKSAKVHLQEVKSMKTKMVNTLYNEYVPKPLNEAGIKSIPVPHLREVAKEEKDFLSSAVNSRMSAAERDAGKASTAGYPEGYDAFVGAGTGAIAKPSSKFDPNKLIKAVAAAEGVDLTKHELTYTELKETRKYYRRQAHNSFATPEEKEAYRRLSSALDEDIAKFAESSDAGREFALRFKLANEQWAEHVSPFRNKDVKKIFESDEGHELLIDFFKGDPLKTGKVKLVKSILNTAHDPNGKAIYEQLRNKYIASSFLGSGFDWSPTKLINKLGTPGKGGLTYYPHVKELFADDPEFLETLKRAAQSGEPLEKVARKHPELMEAVRTSLKNQPQNFYKLIQHNDTTKVINLYKALGNGSEEAGRASETGEILRRTFVEKVLLPKGQRATEPAIKLWKKGLNKFSDSTLKSVLGEDQAKSLIAFREKLNKASLQEGLEESSLGYSTKKAFYSFLDYAPFLALGFAPVESTVIGVANIGTRYAASRWLIKPSTTDFLAKYGYLPPPDFINKEAGQSSVSQFLRGYTHSQEEPKELGEKYFNQGSDSLKELLMGSSTP